MLYLLVLIGVATVFAVIWAAAGPRRQRPVAPRRVVAPDDDPEFLRRISQRPPDDRDRT